MNGAVYSMTGYATGTLPQGITLDIRSVNSRFLDLSFKLPDAYRHLESKLREAVNAQVRRGKCEIRLNINVQAGSPKSIPSSLSDDSIKDLLTQQAKIQQLAPQAQALTVAEIMALANIKTDTSPEALPSDGQVVALMQTVMQDFMQARAIEGGKLTLIMRQQVQTLRQLQTSVTPLIPDLIEQQRQRFLQKFHEAITDSGGKLTPSMAEERALAEATAFALRIDITEEVNRLGSHVHEIESLLANGTEGTKLELGKRLEFLIQELQREANTLGSKSATLATTQIAIDMKVLIEQLREQVQNIE